MTFCRVKREEICTKIAIGDFRINRYRLIAAIEADIFFLGVGTMIGVLSLSWFILGASGFGFLITGAITATTLFLYIQYKEKNKKGFLIHWLYSRGIWKPKYKGHEGLPEDFLPEGWTYEFRD